MSTPGDGATGPGAALKRAREARELSVLEVADALNLTVRVVKLLEDEAWAELPRPAFTRGYLRAYARLMGEDAEGIAAGYTAAVGDVTAEVPLERMEVEPRGLTETMHRHPGAVLSASVAIAVGIVVALLWWVWPEETQPTDRTVEAPALRTAPQVATSPAQTSRAPGASREDPPVSEPVIEAAPTPTDEPRPPAEEPAAAVAADDTSVSGPAPEDEELDSVFADEEPATRVRRISPEGNDRLTLTFTNDCWVEVKDPQGTNLYSDLSRAGDALELVGEAPFRLLLGYAPGVALAFNGERVVLTAHTRNNVASLVLGQ